MRSLLCYAHAMTMILSCHMQNFLAIRSLKFRWEHNEISNEFEFRWTKPCVWNGQHYQYKKCTMLCHVLVKLSKTPNKNNKYQNILTLKELWWNEILRSLKLWICTCIFMTKWSPLRIKSYIPSMMYTAFNSLRVSDAYMRRWTGSSLVQIMARRQAIIWTNAGILLIGL